MSEYLLPHHKPNQIPNFSLHFPLSSLQLDKTLSNSLELHFQNSEISPIGEVSSCFTQITDRGFQFKSPSVKLESQVTKSSYELLTIICEQQKFLLPVLPNDSFPTVKNRIANIIEKDINEYDLSVGEVQLGDENYWLMKQAIKRQSICVNMRQAQEGKNYPIKGNIKLVESVVQSSDKLGEDEESMQIEIITPKKLKIQKKISCSASLQNIKNQEQYIVQKEKSKQLKYSSIEPYIMHKAESEERGENMNRLIKLEVAKETISFGSLQQSKIQESVVEIQSDDGWQYFRMICPLGCTILDIKLKLGKLLRISADLIQVIGCQNFEQIESLGEERNKVKYLIRN